MTQENSQNCEMVTARLKDILGGYSKKCCRTIPLTGEMVVKAMELARKGDTSSDLVPPSPVTQVYKILDLVVAKERIRLD